MLLLIPGPVATRPEVRAAQALDIAPWDSGFRPLYREVRAMIAAIAGDILATHAVLPLQGSGHFAIEAAIRTFVPAGGKLLIPMCGSYAERMARLARECGRQVVELPVAPDARVPPDAVGAALAMDPAIGHVGLVYSETSSGIVHDPEAIGAVVRASGRRMILDAVSAFGALPLDMTAHPEIDAAVFTANKCLEGLPGVSFILTPNAAVAAAKGQAGSWSLDLHDIYAAASRDDWGSFRFTPPTSILAALRTALRLHAAEGGSPARLQRYQDNADALYHGVESIGLHPYLPRTVQGPIVVNIHAPADPAWSLAAFVIALKRRGFVISDFYNTVSPSFRVGCIGALTSADLRRFVTAADLALTEIGVTRRGAVQ